MSVLITTASLLVGLSLACGHRYDGVIVDDIKNETRTSLQHNGTEEKTNHTETVKQAATAAKSSQKTSATRGLVGSSDVPNLISDAETANGMALAMPANHNKLAQSTRKMPELGKTSGFVTPDENNRQFTGENYMALQHDAPEKDITNLLLADPTAEVSEDNTNQLSQSLLATFPEENNDAIQETTDSAHSMEHKFLLPPGYEETGDRLQSEVEVNLPFHNHVNVFKELMIKAKKRTSPGLFHSGPCSMWKGAGWSESCCVGEWYPWPVCDCIGYNTCTEWAVGE